MGKPDNLRGWYGFDFDGTLAYHSNSSPHRNGEPIQPMVDLVKKLLAKGCEVKIFTARASTRDKVARRIQIDLIQNWCDIHIGKRLDVTCTKDFEMIRLYDDRAVRVIPNTGTIVEYHGEHPSWE